LQPDFQNTTAVDTIYRNTDLQASALTNKQTSLPSHIYRTHILSIPPMSCTSNQRVQHQNQTPVNIKYSRHQA